MPYGWLRSYWVCLLWVVIRVFLSLCSAKFYFFCSAMSREIPLNESCTRILCVVGIFYSSWKPDLKNVYRWRWTSDRRKCDELCCCFAELFHDFGGMCLGPTLGNVANPEQLRRPLCTSRRPTNDGVSWCGISLRFEKRPPAPKRRKTRLLAVRWCSPLVCSRVDAFVSYSGGECSFQRTP